MPTEERRKLLASIRVPFNTHVAAFEFDLPPPDAESWDALKKKVTDEPLLMTYVRSNADYWDIGVAEAKGFFAEEGFEPQYVSNAGSVQSTAPMNFLRITPLRSMM